MCMLSESTKLRLSDSCCATGFSKAEPFPKIILDNFLEHELAMKIASEFPSRSASFIEKYSNLIEVKDTLNHWSKFQPNTYRVLNYFCSVEFVELISRTLLKTTGNLFPDYGLHGGGIHMHGPGGKSNVHLDYSLHPKLKLQRKLNLLLYLTPEWNEDWGGALGLYESKSNKNPGRLIEKVFPHFNRAIIFDVTNAWHGLPESICCPNNVSRNSLAAYYLQTPDSSADFSRLKAKFVAAPWQENDPDVQDLIAKRASLTQAQSIY